MKALYGLLIIGLVGLFALWVVANTANQHQNERGPVSVPDDVYDPVRAGEDLPQGFRQLLPRDAIRPGATRRSPLRQRANGTTTSS